MNLRLGVNRDKAGVQRASDIRRIARVSILSIVAICSAAGIATAADDAGEADRAEAFLHLARETTAAYRVMPGTSAEPLSLLPDPILVWTNPEVGQLHGGLFLWTLEGRPAAVAAVYKWFAPYTHSTIELHSLTLHPLTMHSAEEQVWSSTRAGVEFSEIAQAPEPADSDGRRLRQMRDLARRCSADSTDREGEHRELRLLTQPLFRYDNSGPDVLDGAVFGFVRGTDPEILLLIEARRSNSGITWQRAAARLNSIQLRLLDRDEVVWEAPELPWGEVRNQTRPYFSIRLSE